MLIVISPAKTLDYETPPTTKKTTQPVFLSRSAELVADARKLSPEQVGKLMGISDKLADLNHRRFMNWGEPFDPDNAKQAVLTFKGDVYTGLDAESMSAVDLTYAQKHLRILSGLYGLLRPLDLMQAYRLEMGLKFANSGGKNLYEFWGTEITDGLNAQLKSLKSEVVVNLASNVFLRAVQTRGLKAVVFSRLL
jgi:cytoplasmic iron level regulating protein YaaA (DUF328/UPF0246 family)